MINKIEKLQIIWLAIILSLGLIISTKTATNSLSNDRISVTGSANKIVISDSARLEFQILTRKSDKQTAYNALKSQLPIVIKYLEEKGLTDIDQKSINGYYSYKYNSNGSMTNEIAYYNLSQTIIVKSKDVKKIKNVSNDIQNLISKGLDIDVINTEYFYSNLSDIKIELLEEATKNAKDRASAMLKATNNKPGKIQSVQMGVFQITPVDSTSVSDMGISDTSTVDKKITAVANIIFRIK